MNLFKLDDATTRIYNREYLEFLIDWVREYLNIHSESSKDMRCALVIRRNGRIQFYYRQDRDGADIITYDATNVLDDGRPTCYAPRLLEEGELYSMQYDLRTDLAAFRYCGGFKEFPAILRRYQKEGFKKDLRR